MKIRVRGGFSDRNSIKPISTVIQYEDFLPETRVIFYNSLVDMINFQILSQSFDKELVAKAIATDLFNEVYDRWVHSFDKVLEAIKDVMLHNDYDEVLTTIEYICSLIYESYEHYNNRHGYDWFYSSSYKNVYDEMNNLFENEYVGYRFVNSLIVKITNEKEIESIVNASSTPFRKINESISKAISFISVNGKHDYKNAIKESVSAVEQLMNILLNTNGLTLPNSLEQYSHKITIDEHLKTSIREMYKYASDTDGIRHGNNKESNEVTYDEAKFILVVCSGIINYFLTTKDKVIR